MTMRLRYLLPLLLTFATSCGAAEKTKTVTLTVEQAGNLHCALAATKGQDRQPACANVETYEDVIKEGDRERMVTRRYSYKPGVTSAMAKNILALRYVIENFERERAVLQEKLITSNSQPDAANATDAEKRANEAAKQAALAEFNRQIRDLYSAKTEFNLYTFSDAELDLTKNAFPGSLLAVLDPIRE